MKAFDYCCCCINLRSGSIIIAIIQILSGFGIFLQVDFEFSRRDGTEGETNSRGRAPLIYMYFWSVIVACATSVIAGICLLFGAINHNAILTLMNLIITSILLVICNIIGPLGIVLTEGEKDERALNLRIASAIFLIVYSVLGFYFWMCVLSFLFKFKSGKYVFWKD